MGKPMVRVPIYNDVPTFTFGCELSRRRIENTVRYSNREESQRREGGGKREREFHDRSYSIPEIAGKWESAATNVPSSVRTRVRSIARRVRPSAIFDVEKEAGQRPPPQMASIKRESSTFYTILPSRMQTRPVSRSHRKDFEIL